jgi:ubiquinol-cytochrome c reductase cytochrome c subunit
MKTIRSLCSLGVLGAAIMTLSSGSAFAADAAKGKLAYEKNGCWQCHGFVGQGGITGPKLAPDPKPLEVINAFVRYTTGPMPPYPETILSKADMDDIYAYLKSIPKARDYKSIPLLNF